MSARKQRKIVQPNAAAGDQPRHSAAEYEFVRSIGAVRQERGVEEAIWLCDAMAEIMRGASAETAATRVEARNPQRTNRKRPDIDVLGALIFLRNSIAKMDAALTFDQRAALMLLVDLALRDLHPDSLPAWLPLYQAMDHDRQQEIDQFVLDRAQLAKSADDGTH